MAKKSGTKSRSRDLMQSVDPATRHGIISIALFALALVLFFSLFGWAGTVGQYVNTVLSAIVGLGRYALPIFLLIVVYNLLYPREEAELSPLFSVGLVVMAGSVFGLMDVMKPQAGGYIGVALTYIFRQYASVGVAVVIFAALLLMSILIVFNTSLQHLIQYLPARSWLGKTLRFSVALFGSARQRIAIAKEQALASVEEELEEIEEEEEVGEDDVSFAERDLLDDIET